MGILSTNPQIYYAAGGDHGNYRYITLTEIMDSFRAAYVGKDKICERVLDNDITFHALRAMQELSYDTLKSIKSQEIEIPPALIMTLPHDYVNYVKLTWTDGSGIEHIIHPVSKTSNPFAIDQDADGTYNFDSSGELKEQDATDHNSDTWTSYKTTTPSEIVHDDYNDDTYWRLRGERYGLDPQHAQANGSFFIDHVQGRIHFSSNINGKTITLKYISDGIVTTTGEKNSINIDAILVPKLAEEAIYKWILYGVLFARRDTNPNLLVQVKRERSAETRKAKIRLSNIKIEEITQTLRGGSKVIKH